MTMENKGILRIATLASMVFMALAAIFVILIWIFGDEKVSSSLQGSVLDPFFIISYIALILCVVLALAFPIAYIINNPKKAIKALFVLAGLVVVLLISFVLSPNNYTQTELEIRDISATTARWVGTGLVFTYIVGILAILAAIYSGISKIFK